MTLLTLALVGLVGAGIAVVVWVKRWRVAQQPTTLHRLEDYQAMVDQGLLRPEEFERIRIHLAKSEPTPPALPDTGPAAPALSPAPLNGKKEEVKEKE